ncbi:hypothetical protein [Streptomyces somaliensis]|uniref:Uncharacterized protein n=1 Tax=Streptomyces somaliensis (strain ATCC 33201 / DSM 40738 / JCM 12659 / KCTC 9044 / NCTC 11332 / NRRL B-12077 / IP 733) TaxID=1134445 RepID=A0AA44DC57_STRE0|nr:hypothetical protein [Streptomyces somaliensis]NKY14158.1 hypothetical protein [Streptomyces somaliensis DSM 40738]
MSIIPTLVRLLLGLLAPGSGRRRAGTSRPTATPGLTDTPTRREVPRAGLPRLRSPYGSAEPLDGDASPLVRPYLLAHERRENQARRRLTLLLAADFGIDLDTRILHGAGVPP